jgi:hypothetical protein
MRSIIRLLLLSTFATIPFANAATFAYHGTLQDGGKPAEGQYDLELTLYSAPTGGSAVGGPLALYAVPVHAGSFSTEADFGPATRVQGDAWLAVKVRAAGTGEFAALSARTAVTAATTTSVCPGAWTLNGNAGNPAGSYLGTADAQPLTFEVNGAQAGQITAGAFGNISVVFGSSSNVVAADAYFDTISGGIANSAGSGFTTVGGGHGNDAAGDSSTVGGGTLNQATGMNSTICGGFNNHADGIESFVGGGGQLNSASGVQSVVAGGASNSASGQGSTVVGGFSNQAGGYVSFAGGSHAKVRDAVEAGAGSGDYGTFVWSDTTSGDQGFTSTGPNQFLVHAAGGVGINAPPIASSVELTLSSVPTDNTASLFMHGGTAADGIRSSAGAGTGNNDAIFFIDNYDGTHVTRRFTLKSGFAGFNQSNPGAPLVIGTTGNMTNGNGAHVNVDGTYSSSSSREFKEAFAALDPLDILQRVVALPIQTWQYKGAETGRHLGPVAEDFKSIFGLGREDRYITTVDESGVALAAIQGLNAKVEAENTRLNRENAELRGQLDKDHRELVDIIARLNQLEARQGE